jgi:hypothetical protein
MSLGAYKTKGLIRIAKNSAEVIYARGLRLSMPEGWGYLCPRDEVIYARGLRLSMIWLSNFFTMSVPDEGYSRNVSCTLKPEGYVLLLLFLSELPVSPLHSSFWLYMPEGWGYLCPRAEVIYVRGMRLSMPEGWGHLCPRLSMPEGWCYLCPREIDLSLNNN